MISSVCIQRGQYWEMRIIVLPGLSFLVVTSLLDASVAFYFRWRLRRRFSRLHDRKMASDDDSAEGRRGGWLELSAQVEQQPTYASREWARPRSE